MFLVIVTPLVVAVLVAAAKPEVGLVASQWRAVEPLVHAPERVQAAGERGIRVVDDAVLERERAHARLLAYIRRRIGSRHGCELRHTGTRRFEERPGVEFGVVVFSLSSALLLLGDQHVEVVVEVAAERGRPREAPAHATLVGLQLPERRTRDRPNRDIVVLEVDDEAVEAVGDRRARGTA